MTVLRRSVRTTHANSTAGARSRQGVKGFARDGHGRAPMANTEWNHATGVTRDSEPRPMDGRLVWRAPPSGRWIGARNMTATWAGRADAPGRTQPPLLLFFSPHRWRQPKQRSLIPERSEAMPTLQVTGADGASGSRSATDSAGGHRKGSPDRDLTPHKVLSPCSNHMGWATEISKSWIDTREHFHQ